MAARAGGITLHAEQFTDLIDRAIAATSEADH